MQKCLFKDINTSDAISYLENKGYVITKVKDYPDLSLDHVVSTFYDLLAKKFGQEYSILCQNEGNFDNDRRVLKSFQQILYKKGIPKKAANFIAFRLVQRFFFFYDQLYLRTKIRSLSFLFSPKGSWIQLKISQLDKKHQETLENSEWYDALVDKMCYTEDGRLEELRTKREKELLEKENHQISTTYSLLK